MGRDGVGLNGELLSSTCKAPVSVSSMGDRRLSREADIEQPMGPTRSLEPSSYIHTMAAFGKFPITNS